MVFREKIFFLQLCFYNEWNIAIRKPYELKSVQCICHLWSKSSYKNASNTKSPTKKVIWEKNGFFPLRTFPVATRPTSISGFFRRRKWIRNNNISGFIVTSRAADWTEKLCRSGRCNKLLHFPCQQYYKFTDITHSQHKNENPNVCISVGRWMAKLVSCCFPRIL